VLLAARFRKESQFNMWI